ncbi:MAG: YfhO family protein [Eubacterium sp.]|nr:YfhO family protein [Eubacterium sp.]
MAETKKTEKKNTFISRNWSWLAAMAVTAVFMTLAMIIMKVSPFGTGCFALVDSIHQYVPFMSDYQDKLLNGDSLFYTWDVGLGQNFQSLLLYYMASPLNLIIVFFTRKGIITMFSVLVSVKIVISAGAFGYMLSRIKHGTDNNMVILVLSLCYSLNNYMCGYYWNLMWLDCIMVFPLIILGFQRLMENRDPKLYVLTLFYSMFCNYYISFIICIFLILWFLVSEHKNFKKFVIDGILFSGYSILAAAMSALSLIMAYLAIMKTASAGYTHPEWKIYQSFFELIKYQFFLSCPINMDSFDGNANLYCGMLPFLLLFVYAFSDRAKLWEKIKRLILVAFMFLSMNEQLLNYIWHGFHNQFGIPNRFSFLYMFTLIYIAYDVLYDVKDLSQTAVIIGAICSSSILALTYYKVDFDTLVSPLLMLILGSALIVVYSVMLLIRAESKKGNIILMTLLSVVVLAEIITNATFALKNHGACDGDYYMQYTTSMQETVSAVEELAEAKGSIFYRSDIYSPIMLDENTYCNLKSIGTFCTTVRGDMIDAMSHLGFYTGSNEYLFFGSNPVTNDLLGLRYVYLRDGDFYPCENDYKLVYNGDRIRVYENSDAMSIAFGVNDDVDEWDTATYDCAKVINDFAYKATGTYNILEPVHPVYGVSGEGCDADYNTSAADLISYENGEGDTITINATMVVSDKGRYIANIRANYLEELTYYVNEEEMCSDRLFTQLFDMGELEPGDIVRFKMEFNEDYSKSGTISMFMSMLNKDNLALFRGRLKKHEIILSEVTDDSIKGAVNLDGNQLLFTTIPYDEGWKAYADGERVETEMVGDGFLGLRLDAGEHEIELKFIPNGFIPGLIISIIGWCIFIGILIIRKKKPITKEEA